MQNSTANAATASDPVSAETKVYYDFRSQLKLIVEREWGKASTSMLDKKNQSSQEISCLDFFAISIS